MLMAERQSLYAPAAMTDDWRSGNSLPERPQWETDRTPSTARAQARARRNKSKALIGFGLFITGILVVNLLIQSMVIQRDYDIQQLQGKIANIKREMVATRIEMASLESFDRIQAIAENRLGMKVADSSDYQCIAAVPAAKKEAPRAYARQNQPLDKENVWNQIAAWVGNAGSAMAQNQ